MNLRRSRPGGPGWTLPGPPASLDRMSLRFGRYETLRAIAHDAERLVVTDVEGTPFVVPLGGTEPVRPLAVFEPGGAPRGCP